MAYDIDPYTILGLAPDASEQDIEDAYHKLEQRLNVPNHPYAEAAQQQLDAATEAKTLLTSSRHRRQFDEWANKRRNDKSVQNTHFSLGVVTSKRIITPMPEQQVVYVLAEIQTPSKATEIMENLDTGVNLALVLDQSKSMEDEGRMNKVIVAAQTLITDLTPNDVISVIAFNDRASTIIPATHVQDKMTLRARIGMIKPKGGTEIFQGLSEGVNQIRRYATPNMINHVILLTDGRTFGDEDKCLELARQMGKEGIGLSTMGLGSDWNDQFLDELASITGGTTTYIKSVNKVNHFMDEQVRNLANVFAERMELSIVPEPDIGIEMAFKLAPSPQPLSNASGIIPLGSLTAKRPISVLLQLQLPPDMAEGYHPIVRIVSSGNMMLDQARRHAIVSDLTLQVSSEPGHTDEPPDSIVDALSKLTLYRMQEQAHEAMDRGDFEEATRRLQLLGTRLMDMGYSELGQQTLTEAQHISQTHMLSNDSSSKTIKYATRALIQPGAVKEALTMLLSDD